jgi:vacuolar-type H+-ATPase subunit H
MIDTLDDLVCNAKPIRLTSQVRVDRQGIYDILDQIRATVPEEIKQARWIVKERQDMLAEARREAEQMIKHARELEAHLISDEEVTEQAERAAEDIIEDARGRARDRARRRGPRRRDPQHARDQSLEIHRRRSARPRPPCGERRGGRQRMS